MEKSTKRADHGSRLCASDGRSCLLTLRPWTVAPLLSRNVSNDVCAWHKARAPAPTAGRRDGLANPGETLGQNPLIVLTQPCWTPGEGLASHLEGSPPSWEMTPKRTHEGHLLWGGMKAGGSGPVQDLPATHSVPSREGCLQDKKALAQRAGWHRKDLHLETGPFAQFYTIFQFHSQGSAEGHTPK